VLKAENAERMLSETLECDKGILSPFRYDCHSRPFVSLLLHPLCTHID
jgi:hypothetical protein